MLSSTRTVQTFSVYGNGNFEGNEKHKWIVLFKSWRCPSGVDSQWNRNKKDNEKKKSFKTWCSQAGPDAYSRLNDDGWVDLGKCWHCFYIFPSCYILLLIGSLSRHDPLSLSRYIWISLLILHSHFLNILEYHYFLFTLTF